MLGILAQTPAGVAGGTGWVPAGAIAAMDFVNQRYFAGGALQSVDLLVGGDGFDASYIGPSGMLIPTSSGKSFPYGNRAEAAGDLLAALSDVYVGGGTVVLEASSASFADTFGLHRFLEVKNGTYFGSPDEAYSLSGAVAPSSKITGADLYSAAIDSTNFGSSGIQKIALTVARETVPATTWQWALSVNGESAITQDLSYGLEGSAPDFAFIGQWAYDPNDDVDDYYIRALTVYPGLDPSELAALTAL